MVIEQTSEQLMKNLMDDTLTYEELRNFYHLVINNFDEIINFNSHKPYKNVGNLFTLMLEIDNFENDPDNRQSFASLGYYVLCKGMEKFGLEENGNFKIGKYSVQIELLSPRISIMLASKISMQYCLSEISDKVDEYFTFANHLRKESFDLEDMILCDSYTVKYLCSIDMNPVFYFGANKHSLEIYQKYSTYGDLEKRIENGRNTQIKLFNHLKNKIELQKNLKY